MVDITEKFYVGKDPRDTPKGFKRKLPPGVEKGKIPRQIDGMIRGQKVDTDKPVVTVPEGEEEE